MSLKDEFLELLEKDREFRYAVLGYLGLDEVVRRMDEHQKTQTKILERIEGIEREQTRIWEEVKALREDFKELREEQARLREDFNKMLARIGDLEAGHVELRRSYRGLERAFRWLEAGMLVGFDSLRKFAGVTLEEFVREMLSGSLVKRGVLPEGACLQKVTLNGEEINLFYEDPLVVGEATAYAESTEEVDKLLRKSKVAREKYGKEPMLLLVILTAPRKVAREIRALSEKHNIELVMGREI